MKILDSNKKNFYNELEKIAAQNLAVFWPNQGDGDRGAHVNVSGAGITKYARNQKEAQKLLVDDKVKIAIQINGKLRSEIEVEKDREEESVKSLAVTDKKIEKYLEGNEIKKIIYVPGKIINIVI